MASLTSFLRAIGRMFSGSSTATTRSPGTGSTGTRSPGTRSPGQTGQNATVRVDPRAVSGVALGYAPRADKRPDPGEVVWTWVPFEENDGRGKDRPMLVVARLSASTCLGVALTSKSHDGDRGSVGIGAGAWDRSGRASYARIDRLFRVHDGGMRREGAALDARTYAVVAKALKARYRW